MDELQTILYLRIYFPEKPVDYLQSMYRKCNNNINSTIYELAKSKPQKENVLNDLLNTVQTLFCCSNKLKEIQKEDSLLQAEEFFKIDIGDHFAKSLTEKFADDTLKLPYGFKPVIEIPVEFGRQLFICYVESIHQQKKEQADHLQHLAEIESQLLDTHIQTNKVTNKLETKPTKEIKTSPVVKPSSGKYSNKNIESTSMQEIKSNQESETIFKLRLQAEEQRHRELMQSPMYLREIARQHVQKQHNLLDVARKAQKNDNQDLADAYFEQAKLQALLSQKVNKIASEVVLKENRQERPSENTIDLRHYEVKKAIQNFDTFVDNEINNLCYSVKNNKCLMVITGREEFSADGSLKIKPSVIKRIGTRQLRYK